MARFIGALRLLFILVIVGLVYGKAPLHRPRPYVFPRQEEVEADGEIVLDCAVSCELGTCGADTCFNTQRRRALTSSETWSPDDFFGNGTTRPLVKRQWKMATSATNSALQNQLPPYTIDQVNAYVFNQLDTDGAYDNQYGQMLSFLNGVDQRAVSQNAMFGTAPFQFGTGGLHGCTMVTIVSNRAVWMAHFWESYSHGKPNQVALTARLGFTAFQERVTAFLTGVTVNPDTADSGYYKQAIRAVVDGPLTKNIPYLTPQGNPVNNADFNQPGDNTKVFIMTPAVDSASSKTPDPPMKYADRIGTVVTALEAYLGDNIDVYTYPYVRIDTETDPDALWSDQRGTALFQFDPDADGNGTPQWRLFYENRMYWGPQPQQGS